jgi:RimJ/RimL family protein N-acetyltransferase
MTICEPICGERVCLVPLSVEGVDDWVRWMADPETTRYLYAPGDRPKGPFTRAVALDWGRRILADPERIVFGLVEAGAARPIGDARLMLATRRRARFSIMIGEASGRGRGLGREATELVCRFGFEQLGLERIELEVDPRNEPAIRAYLAVGFHHRRRHVMRLDRATWAAERKERQAC